MNVIPQAENFTLKNGLKVVTERIPSLRSVALGIMVEVGSGNEGLKEAGISHFIEHMMFKGTKKRSAFEIAHALDAVGGKINAYTSKEVTMYYAVVLDQHLLTALDVLSDMLQSSIFNPQEMETEKGVVLEEIKMYEDTPDELIHDLFAEHILGGHPLAKPTIGFIDTIKKVSRDDILGYLQRFYSPKNMLISVAGALPENIAKLIEKYFCTHQGGTANLTLPSATVKGAINLRQKKTEQTHLCLGTRGPAHDDEARYAFALMDNILGGSMSSRLFQEVREKRGLAYSIYSTSSPFRDFGLAYTYAGTSRENLEQVVGLILEQFIKIKKEGLTESEITRGKEYLKGTLVLGLESSSARMSWLAKCQMFHGRVITVDEVFKKIDQVRNDDIIKLAERYFCDEYLALSVIGDLESLPFKELKC